MSQLKQEEIISAVQKIVADTYGGPHTAPEIRPSWHLHAPWPPIGMDDIRLAGMITPLNTLIRMYQPKAGITAKDLAKTDTVVSLTKLVLKKIIK